MIKELYDGLRFFWKNDRNEFWEIVGGGFLVMFVFFFTMLVLIPIFG